LPCFICTFITSLVMLAPMIPQAQAAVSTPKSIPGCSAKAVRHTRSLASARVPKLRLKCAQAHKSASVLNYYRHAGHWQVAPAYKHWWDLPDARWRKVVRESRQDQRQRQIQLSKLEAQIKALVPDSRPKLEHDWLYDSLLCIHGGEGAWNAVSDTIPTYYGGLQMDMSFMHTYGPEFYAKWGTANRWPPWAQMIAAERAYHAGRGFYPWPQTARDCKLI
jgi:hypothetical protein